MELLSLEEEKLLYWFGDDNLNNTIRRLQYVGMLATDNDFKKVAFGLSNGKQQTEEYADKQPENDILPEAETETEKEN